MTYLARPGSNPTKIVATLGPASSTPALMDALITAGADAFRLNFSHGDHASHAALIREARAAAGRKQSPLALLADLQGPKIRTGPLEGGRAVTLAAGGEITLTSEKVSGNAREVGTCYDALPLDVKPGDRLLLDDGALELQVLESSPPRIHCRVIVGGLLGEHKGINLPEVTVSAPSLTEKDRLDLRFALEQGVDYVALSFVRKASDVRELRELILSWGKEAGIVAKLEKPEALNELEEIVRLSDAVMVARGDLGVELPPEEVPLWQKRIIAVCARFRKPVITATQMLESMRTNPRPTRAEASDVANAVLDGTDCVMLSGETASGRYPVEAVAMMSRIATTAERMEARGIHPDLAPVPWAALDVADALARAGVRVAEQVEAAAIVAFTATGATPRLVSKYRPRLPLLAATSSPAVARRCNLFWGVTPLLIPASDNTDSMVQVLQDAILSAGLAESGDTVVILAGSSPGGAGSTNLVKVQVLG